MGSPPALLALVTVVPRGVKWGVPAPRVEGSSPASVRQLWWTFSQYALHVLVFTQDEMTGLMLNQECAESRDLHALKEMEVWRSGLEQQTHAGTCPKEPLDVSWDVSSVQTGTGQHWGGEGQGAGVKLSKTFTDRKN